MDTVSDAVFTVDRDFVVTSFNRAAEDATGLKRADVIGRHCYEMLHDTVCDYIAECPMTHVFDARRCEESRELDIVHRGRPAASLRVSVHALRDGAGALLGGIELFRNYPAGDARPQHARGGSAELPILDATERRTIEDVLRRHDWNRAKTCAELHISRTTLWRKIQKFGISPRRPGA